MWRWSRFPGLRFALFRWTFALFWPLMIAGCATEEPVVDDDDSAEPELIAACINEFMADNAMTVDDGSEKYPDWIELHSLSDEDQSLEGHFISDSLEDRFRHRLSGDLWLPARGFLLLWADDQRQLGIDHLRFELSSDGEAIGLFGPEGEPIDAVEFEAQTTDFSAARIPDGGGEWVITYHPTPGWSNEGP